MWEALFDRINNCRGSRFAVVSKLCTEANYGAQRSSMILLFIISKNFFHFILSNVLVLYCLISLIKNGVQTAVLCRLNHTVNLHHGEGGMVAGDPREVVLQHGQGAGQRHVAAAAEQSHA